MIRLSYLGSFEEGFVYELLAVDLLRKLEKEKKLFQIRGENIQDQVEENTYRT